MVLLLLYCDMSLNPGHLMLGVLNARSVRNMGPLLADIVASHDLDFLCLTETHVHLSDTGSFLQSITPPDFMFLQRPHPSGIGGGVNIFIRSFYRSYKTESSFYRLFENMVISIGLHGRSIVYLNLRPPRSCTCKFQDEFITFVGFLLSIKPLYYICGNFNFHVD